MMKRFFATLPLSGLILLSGVAVAPASAQDSACYMVDASGRRVNLGSLCGDTPAGTTSPQNRNIFQAKIKRRDRGTPIIDVTFNGNQRFEMIVDTGASGTLITQRMAAALRVTPIGTVKGDTASQTNVEFPVGYVQSIGVGGAVAKNVLVAIAGAEQNVGLLGHDFFGNYDVVIRKDTVEFRLRQQ